MFRFKFVDENNNPINVKTLRIVSDNNDLAWYYWPLANSQQYTCSEITTNLAAATTDYIYVALCIDEFRSAGDKFTFVATDSDDKEYKGTKAVPDGGFKNGKYYYNTQAIQLTRQYVVASHHHMDQPERRCGA